MESSKKDIKSDLIGLKSQLEYVEKEMEDKLKEVDSKEEKFRELEQRVEEILLNKDTIITLNIGGKNFQTKSSTLLKVKDTLFYRILCKDVEENHEFRKEMFFDRSFNHFDIILNYLRTQRFSLKGFSKYDLEEIQREAEYYGIDDILTSIEELKREVEIVSMDCSNRYSTAGTHSFKELNDKSLTKGICVESPYQIILEFNYEVEFDKIDVGGWNGNTSLWYPGNGANAQIFTSLDKKSWISVGNLPSNYGGSISTVNLKRSSAKYIKFQHNSYVGIGYLKILLV